MSQPNTPVTIPKAKHEIRDVMKLIIFSSIGLILFFVPVIGGETPLLFTIKMAKTYLGAGLSAFAVVATIALMIASAFSKKVPLINKYMGNDGLVTKILYVLGSVFGVMIFFKIGPAFILHPDTGALALHLAASILVTILFAGFFVTFITNFGLLQFTGIIMEPIMRPLYKVPGYAALDAIIAIVCSAAVGVFEINKNLVNKLYTKRESTIVVTNFAMCSLGFFVVLCDIAGITELYGLATVTAIIIAFIIPLITCRIPPLSNISNDYIDGTPYVPAVKVQGQAPIFVRAWDAAVETARDAKMKTIAHGFAESFFFAIKIAAYVLSIATISCVIGVFTPIFDWIGAPIIPILNLLQIPNAAEIAPSVLVGITEIAMPALLIAGKNVVPAASFFIVVLSTVQIIFFTESANAIMESKIPLGFIKLIVVFLIRTAIAVPLVAAAVHLLF